MLKEKTASAAQPPKISSQVIDGFLKSPQKIINSARPPAGHLHQAADRTHTLMRGSVKKPAAAYDDKIRRPAGFDPAREARAKAATKHSSVDRFGAPMAKDIPARPRPVVQAKVVPRGAQTTTASAAVALPSMITSSSHQRLERLLDEALLKADAHKKALKYQAARHFWQRPSFLGRWTGLKLALIALILLAAGGIIAWQKIPQISVKVAAIKAHVSATVPSYKPAGYSLASPASAQAGAVVMTYVAPSTGKSFDLAQKPSSMTSSNLAQSVVPQGTQVQTSQVDGNTVYVYGPSNNAVWLNNGVMYTLKDHANLSPDEILKFVRGTNQ